MDQYDVIQTNGKIIRTKSLIVDQQ